MSSGQVVRPPKVVLGRDGTMQAETGVVRIIDRSAVTGTAYRTLFVSTPSRRLSCSIEVFFDSVDEGKIDDFGDTDTANALSLWRIDAMTTAPGGRRSFLHRILSGDGSTAALGRLPACYEMDTAIRVVRLFLTLRCPEVAGNGVTGTWCARARWEPNMPMSRDEFAILANQCGISEVGPGVAVPY